MILTAVSVLHIRLHDLTLVKHTSIHDIINIEAFTSYFGINRPLGMKKLPMRMVYLCRQFHKKKSKNYLG